LKTILTGDHLSHKAATAGLLYEVETNSKRISSLPVLQKNFGQGNGMANTEKLSENGHFNKNLYWS